MMQRYTGGAVTAAALFEPTLTEPRAYVVQPPTRKRSIRSKGDVIAVRRKELLAEARLEELLDPKVLRVVLKRLAPLIDDGVVDPGDIRPTRLIAPDALTVIARTVALTVAGVDPPPKGRAAAPVVWTSGEAELLVRVGRVSTSTGDGFIDVTIPVRCDETGPAEVVVTLVTASPKRPLGAVLATSHRPHGPRPIIDRWSDALIAFAWEIVAGTSALLVEGVGRDRDNRPLIPASISASTKGLLIEPMAGHHFTSANLVTRNQ